MNQNMRIHVKNILAGIGTFAILAVAISIVIPSFANYGLGITGTDSSLYTDTGTTTDGGDVVAESPDDSACGYIKTQAFAIASMNAGADGNYYKAKNPNIISRYNEQGDLLNNVTLTGKPKNSNDLSEIGDVLVDKKGDIIVQVLATQDVNGKKLNDQHVRIYSKDGIYQRIITGAPHGNFGTIYQMAINYYNNSDYILYIINGSNTHNYFSNIGIEDKGHKADWNPKGGSNNVLAFVTKSGGKNNYGFIAVQDSPNTISFYDVDSKGTGIWNGVTIGSKGEKDENLNSIFDMTFDEDGNLLVADGTFIKKFSPSGTFITKFALNPEKNGFHPTAISIYAKGGKIYADTGSGKTQVFSKESCGTLVVVKNEIPKTGTDFSFTSYGDGAFPDFKLDDDLDQTLNNKSVFDLIGKKISVAEFPRNENYSIYGTCKSKLGKPSISITSYVDLDLTNNVGDVWTCTFTNCKKGQICPLERDQTKTIN